VDLEKNEKKISQTEKVSNEDVIRKVNKSRNMLNVPMEMQINTG